MKRIAKFEKVSLEQFKKDWADTFPECSEKDMETIYEEIKLPKRATSGYIQEVGWDSSSACS